MEHLMTRQLDLILREGGAEYDWQFDLEVVPNYLDEKGKSWLKEILAELGGNGSFPLLEKLRFDFKIGRQLILWDEELHFNRYRLSTFRSGMYQDLSFPFVESYKRLCRTFEKEALKSGMPQRIWSGPPVAGNLFGKASEPGDFSGNGASGWKLLAYNSAQTDLQTRIHGYKLLRLNPFETLMTGGSLKRLDQLLVNPKEEQRAVIFNWLMRKLG
ncbi:hypothetical protein [Algoriphagus sp. AK58]|uniref:DUF7255 family protein n=1 Tax=Algoriphagus sp. AK58 TaxID=1406877 RepID=UPI00165033AB|nr:hypothetical protein [Algoriphagus sp. AK58]MBC6366111.1 hypothetical protein [Algoriphagus sp. AK58]